jgi:hypothetical protein
MDWLMQRCRSLQRQYLQLYLKFEHGEYITLESDDMLNMAVEMVVRYYFSTLDPKEFPQWMEDMDDAWQQQVDDCSETEESDSDAQSEDYDEYF